MPVCMTQKTELVTVPTACELLGSSGFCVLFIEVSPASGTNLALHWSSVNHIVTE